MQWNHESFQSRGELPFPFHSDSQTYFQLILIPSHLIPMNKKWYYIPALFSDKNIACSESTDTSGSCWSSAASITGGGFPSSPSSLYIQTSSAKPNSKKDGGTTLSKDGWTHNQGEAYKKHQPVTREVDNWISQGKTNEIFAEPFKHY